MISDHFYLFTALAAFSKAVQNRLQAVHSPAEIVGIAADNGYQISVSELRLFSPRLNAEHWVWSGKSADWQEAFFSNWGLAEHSG